MNSFYMDEDPLQELLVDKEIAEHEQLAKVLDDLVHIVGEEGKIKTRTNFENLQHHSYKVLTILLARKAAKRLGLIQEDAVTANYISDFLDLSKDEVEMTIDKYDRILGHVVEVPENRYYIDNDYLLASIHTLQEYKNGKRQL